MLYDKPLRVEFDGALYHFTPRDNARKPIFITDTHRVPNFKEIEDNPIIVKVVFILENGNNLNKIFY